MPILNYCLLTLTHLFQPFMVLKTRGALPVDAPDLSPSWTVCHTTISCAKPFFFFLKQFRPPPFPNRFIFLLLLLQSSRLGNFRSAYNFVFYFPISRCRPIPLNLRSQSQYCKGVLNYHGYSTLEKSSSENHCYFLGHRETFLGCFLKNVLLSLWVA